MKISSFLIALLFCISGCAAPSTVMINKQGKQVNCSSVGWGIIGTAIAIGLYQECVDKQKKLCFQSLDDANKGDWA